MNLRFVRLYLAAESRGGRGRLLFLAGCLAIGVAAVVAVAVLTRGLEEGIRKEARRLLGGDFAVSSYRPFPPAVVTVLDRTARSGRADLLELVTMAAAPASEKTRLVELRIVDGEFPLYGELVTEPRVPVGSALARGALVEPELLAALSLRIGDELLLGGNAVRIVGEIRSEPDRIATGLRLGPRVLVSRSAFDSTGLEKFGSRILRRTLVRLPAGAPPREAERVAAQVLAAAGFANLIRVESWTEGQPALRRGLERVRRFLSLVALLSLLVGGVGVAGSVRSFVDSRLDQVAALRTLGLRGRDVVALFLLLLGRMALLGSLAGAAAGLLAAALARALAERSLGATGISLFQPLAVARGVLLGLGVAVMFAAPALLRAGRVPPQRVLRRDAEPLPSGKLAMLGFFLLVGGGIFAAALAEARSVRAAAGFAVAVVGVAVLLAGGAALLARVAKALAPSARGFRSRSALAALGRTGGGAVAAAAAVGFGVAVVLAMAIVDRTLERQLVSELPTGAPTAFFLDVQTDQWAPMQGLLRTARAESVDSVEVVMARLSSIDGIDAEKLAAGTPHGGESRKWALTREQRLTTLATLPEDNRIVAGRWFADDGKPEVSIEQDFARNLGLRLGSRIVFDVQGVPLEAAVTSLRAVEWKTFRINFFLVVEPGVLEGAPSTRLVAARLPPGSEGALRAALARELPNVTLFDVREILVRVSELTGRLAAVVRFLGGFTGATGLLILAGTVAAATSRRGREVALLRTLGATSAQIASALAAEYAAVGLVAGVLGTAGGTLVGLLAAKEGFDLPLEAPVAEVLVALSGTVVLVVVVGLAASARAMRTRPLETLRGE